MSTGERIWDDLVALEKKFWNREDYSEDDREDFENYFKEKEVKE